jgi:hypothetical protein
LVVERGRKSSRKQPAASATAAHTTIPPQQKSKTNGAKAKPKLEPRTSSIVMRGINWYVAVATGAHFAWSFPMPLRAIAFNFSACPRRSLAITIGRTGHVGCAGVGRKLLVLKNVCVLVFAFSGEALGEWECRFFRHGENGTLAR